jgi:hypothetical protein
MSSRSSLEAVWAEIHSFTEGQNSRSARKARSNQRSVSFDYAEHSSSRHHHLDRWLALAVGWRNTVADLQTLI